MAGGPKRRFYSSEPTKENFQRLWDKLYTIGDALDAANATIQQQAATITSQQQQITEVSQATQQAAIAAGKATSASTTSNDTSGPGGGGGSTPPHNHDSQFAIVQAVIADLIAHGDDLSGPCGSFNVTNNVVKWLRPSQPDVGIINKPSGTNCTGYSIDALMYLDGAVYDILIDADNAPPTGVAPNWSYAGQRPASDWRDPV